jgi:DNA-binding response OmpR family regulator
VPIEDVPASGSSAASSEYRRLVLVVNDEPSIADAVSEILDKNGYAAIAAYNEEDALEIARLIPPELVVADAGLSGRHGNEVASVLGAELADCPVILLSAEGATAKPPAWAQSAGNKSEALNKPVRLDNLAAHVSATIKAR